MLNLLQFADLLNERRQQLESIHQSELDRINEEHENNMKTLIKKYEEMVIFKSQFIYFRWDAMKNLS